MRRAPELGAAGAALCGVAVLFAAPALYVPGIALVLLAAVAPVWVWLASAHACVELEPAVTSAYEGERIAAAIRVRRGLLPYGGAELLVGDLSVPLPARRESARVAVSALAERRGPQAVGPARLRISDPLGICVRELRSDTHEVLVLPCVYPVSADASGRLRRRVGRARGDSQLHLDSLRAYDASGSASRIHWPTVARTGELMAREFVGEAESRVLIVVDARLPASDEALDRALRAAASLCAHLARGGGCELLLPGDARAQPIGPALERWSVLHVRLALVRAGTQTAGSAWRGLARTIVHVTAAREPERAAAGAGAYWRVGPYPLAGLEVAFDIAGCAGQLVEEGSLRIAA